MARALVVLVLLLWLPSASAGQSPRDTRLWYQLYDNGVRAAESGDWPAAITALEAARTSGPAPGRRVLFQGDRVDTYNPDYYLGRAYAATGRYAEAEAAFARVETLGLIRQGDREYRDLRRELGTARYNRLIADGERLLASNRFDEAEKAAVDARAIETSADNAGWSSALGNRAASLVQVIRYDRALADADDALNRGELDRARQALGRAGQEKLGPAQTGRAGRADAIESRLRTAEAGRVAAATTQAAEQSDGPKPMALPRPPIPTPYDPGITQETPPAVGANEPSPYDPGTGVVTPVPSADPPEQQAIVAYLRGDYARAIRLLTPLADAPNPSARAFIYLACSNAALVLMGRAGEGVLADARAQLQRAGSLEPFAADRRLVSPSVWRMLGVEQP